MAKNKKSKGQQQAKMSPERFMREKARTLPIGTCYITPDWKESGLSPIIITRVRPSGNLAIGIFLVDTFCIGVKDATYYANMSQIDFKKLIERYESRLGLEEISYDEAHNIIYGAIEFAREGGIEPAKDFKTAGFILEEDTDDIPLIEYEFGKNGKHFLVVKSDRSEMPYYHRLKRTLGDDFKYVMEYVGEDYDDYDDYMSDEPYDDSDYLSKGVTVEGLKQVMKNWHNMMDESNRHPAEIYSYEYPEYPKVLNVKNQFIADELMSADNYDELPRPVIERILALPDDEAAEDISNIIMYEIGRTYQSINDKTIGNADNSAIMHALYLLTQIKSAKGLKAVLEIMRQNSSFADYHFGDFAPEVIHPALYACGMNDIPEIERYINQPGLDHYLKSQAFDALAMIVFIHPERREEVIEVFRKVLKSWVTRLPRQEACDGALAGFLMSNLMDLEAGELVPEIKAVFDTDCVDTTIAGDCNDVLDEVQHRSRLHGLDKYKFPDIYEQYARLKSFSE